MRMSTGAGPPGEKAPTKAAHVEPANAKDARCIYRSSSSEAMQVALHVTWQPATRSSRARPLLCGSLLQTLQRVCTSACARHLIYSIRDKTTGT